jgi:tight adherence protein C
MDFMYAVIAFIVVTGTTVGTAWLAEQWDPAVRRLRGLAVGSGGAAPPVSILRWEDAGTRPAQWRRTLEKLGRAFLGRDPSRQEARQTAVRRRLLWAGFQNPRTVQVFLGAKVLLAFGMGYVYALHGLAARKFFPQVLLVSTILGVIGLFLPDLWLYRRIKKRQQLITNALPDLLDLLVVCVEAGLALDGAIAKVTEPDLAKSTPLHEELHRTHLEFRAGLPRAEALYAMGERTGVDEVRTIVGAFAHTEKLGTSLGDTLRVHAEAARVKRRHRAEKAAHTAPLKMLFPMVFFLLPAIIVVTLGPAVLKIVQLFGPVTR